MSEITTTQVLFERFLRGELSQEQALDALMAALQTHHAAGGALGPIALQKPSGMVLSPTDHARTEALLVALDQRLSAA